MTLISALPTVPSRSSGFSAAQAEAFLEALPDFVTETNAALAYFDLRNADASAVTMWVAGDFSEGDVVWSPATGTNYRAKTTHTSATDPSLDSTNWSAASGIGAADQAKLDLITVTEPVDLDLARVRQSRVASGSIAAKTVVVRKSDGTVSEVSETSTDAAFGGEDTVASKLATDDGRMVCSLGSGKFFFVYHDSATPRVHAKIGTFDGENWSFGAEANIDTAGVVPDRSLYCAYDSTADRVVVAFDYANNLRTYVCSVSGTTITVNTAQNLIGATGDVVSVAVSNGYALFVYNDAPVRAVCASIGSTSLSPGSEITIDATYGSFTIDVQPTLTPNVFVCTYIDTNKTARIIFIERTTSSTIVAGTVGTLQNDSAESFGPLYLGVTAISDGYVLAAYNRQVGTTDARFQIVQHSGRTISSIGTALELLADYKANARCIPINNGLGQAYMMIQDLNGSGNDYLHFVEITHTGTVPAAGTPVVIKSATGWSEKGAAYDSSDGTIAFMAANGANISVFDVAAAGTSSDAGDWLSVSVSAVADGEDVPIYQVGDIVDGLSSLTYGQKVYVDIDGGLTHVVTSYGEIGLALSATEMLITRANS